MSTVPPSTALPALPPASLIAPEQRPAVRVTAVPAQRAAESGADRAAAHDTSTAAAHAQAMAPAPAGSLDAAVAALNQNMQAWSTQLRFEVNETPNRVVIRVIDADSGDVIKTIPSEAVLKAAELLAGQADATRNDTTGTGIQAQA